jgi:hypothetical protein
MNKKKLIIAGFIAISFILLTTSVIFFIEKTRELRKLDPLELEDMSKEEILQTIYERHAQENTPFYYFIPLFGFFGVAVGSAIYFIISTDLEKKDQIIQFNTDVILKLLDPDERKVINKIVESNGKVSQAEITYMDGFTKVKAHRIVERLVQKDILTKEAMGKMRLIRINKELYEFLKTR